MSSQRRSPVVFSLQGRVSVPCGGTLGAVKVLPAGRMLPIRELVIHLGRGGLYEVHLTVIDVAAAAGRGSGGGN